MYLQLKASKFTLPLICGVHLYYFNIEKNKKIDEYRLIYLFFLF